MDVEHLPDLRAAEAALQQSDSLSPQLRPPSAPDEPRSASGTAFNGCSCFFSILSLIVTRSYGGTAPKRVSNETVGRVSSTPNFQRLAGPRFT